MNPVEYDIIVIGGGHAGAEAAWAAAHLGAQVALVSMDPGRIGQMSCNPAIGGLAKGQMVREVDALGGLMGLATDDTGIQFRMLNRSKGPAVWGPRAQADKYKYAIEVQRLLRTCPNLEIVCGEVKEIQTDQRREMRDERQDCTISHLSSLVSDSIVTGVLLADETELRCHLGATSEAVHQIIRANLHRAPMYSGQIQSTGPRYCPSIEDKVVRFADRSTHHIFLEPEGLDTDEIYCNGISTSLPADVQEQMIAMIPGLERARILRYGYAVEYDMVWPTQIKSTLETKVEGG